MIVLSYQSASASEGSFGVWDWSVCCLELSILGLYTMFTSSIDWYLPTLCIYYWLTQSLFVEKFVRLFWDIHTYLQTYLRHVVCNLCKMVCSHDNIMYRSMCRKFFSTKNITIVRYPTVLDVLSLQTYVLFGRERMEDKKRKLHPWVTVSHCITIYMYMTI